MGIKEEMAAIDLRKHDWYGTLSEEEAKGAQDVRPDAFCKLCRQYINGNKRVLPDNDQ